jgi:uncharacterized protein YabE (DUF348 family)
VLLVVIGLALIGLELQKNVTLVVNGQARTISTWGLTVGNLLAKETIRLSTADRLQPVASAWLNEGSVIQLTRASMVSILADGKQRSMRTPLQRAGNILAMAGIRLYPEDQVLVDGEPLSAEQKLPFSGLHTVSVRRAVRVRLETPTGVKTFYSAAPTLGKALWEAGISLQEGDHLAPAAETPLDGPVQASYTPAREITILVDGKQIRTRSAAKNVGEALAEAGLALQGLDYSQPAAHSPLPASGKIDVVRVQEKLEIAQEPMAYEIEYQPDPSLEIDNQRIIESGAFGVMAQQVRLRLENGVEVSRTIEGEWLAREPQNRVIGYGTQITKKVANTAEGKIEYWRAIQMYATSYSPCRLGVPNYCHDITASGLKLQKGVAGVAKSWYGYVVGQRVYVPGYGVAVIADFGNGIPGKYLIDLGFSDHDYQPWHQNVTVYFLWPPPPPEQIMWVLP